MIDESYVNLLHVRASCNASCPLSPVRSCPVLLRCALLCRDTPSGLRACRVHVVLSARYHSLTHVATSTRSLTRGRALHADAALALSMKFTNKGIVRALSVSFSPANRGQHIQWRTNYWPGLNLQSAHLQPQRANGSLSSLSSSPAHYTVHTELSPNSGQQWVQ